MTAWSPFLEAEVQSFQKRVQENLDTYLVFEGETFVAFRAGILSGTEPDTQGEQLTRAHLDKMAYAQTKRLIWNGYQHDPLYHMVSRILAVEVMEEGGHCYLIGMVGFYDQEKYRSFAELGVVIELSDSEPVNVDPELPAEAKIIYNHHRTTSETIADLLQDAPKMVSQDPGKRFDKAVEPLAILTILLTVNLVMANPFVKKLGECAAQDFYNWMKKIYALLASHVVDRVVLELPAGTCKVRFVNAARAAAAVHESTAAIPVALDHARRLLAHPSAQKLDLELLVYEWLEDEKKWLPTHGCSRVVGVISDRRRLAVMDAVMGFSVSGYGELPPAKDQK